MRSLLRIFLVAMTAFAGLAAQGHAMNTAHVIDHKVWVCLDGSMIKSPQQFHDELAHKAGFPDYYGGNLDALWDVLSTWPRDTSLNVIWYDWETSAQALNAQGRMFDRIVATFNEARQQAPVFLSLVDEAYPSAGCGIEIR